MRHFIARMVVCVPIALVLLATRLAHAQALQVLHTFTGGADGARPSASLTFDVRGNLYGTTIYGGNIGVNCQTTGPGCGTVFKLTHTGSGWILTPLYSFSGGDDGMNPVANVVFGPDGLLYGTTHSGGGSGCGGFGCGIVFSLRPPAHACTSALCPWTETILYRFSGDDGASPGAGVIFDATGNVYGTTNFGGAENLGTVYELTPVEDGDWREQVLYGFTGIAGALPNAGLIFDAASNLYGTTYQGGNGGYGTVFELAPKQGGWTAQALYRFYQGSDGYYPEANLIFDAAGNLYSTTIAGGTSNDGTVFELTPAQGGGWTEQVLHSFIGADGGSPAAGLIFDSAGNLYSTTQAGGTYGAGTVFELTPSGETRFRSPK